MFQKTKQEVSHHELAVASGYAKFIPTGLRRWNAQ